MSDRYKNKYRITSTRLQHWDYGWAGEYFVTICTHKRKMHFGYIRNDIMWLNEIGAIVYKEWTKTPSIRPDMNLSLDEFIVMPNHFHGILTIGNNPYNTLLVETQCLASSLNHKPHKLANPPKNKFGSQSKNLAAIISGFKSTVTTQARRINPNFGWQYLFHDHIIRNERSFQRISNYIRNNPASWKEDCFYQ